MSKSLVVNTPFKADHVGSFLRPARLKEARLQFENNEITADHLKQIEDEEITNLLTFKKSQAYE